MDSITENENGLSFLIILEKPGPFYTIRLEVTDANYTYFISSDMIIPKPSLESMIDHLKNSGTAIDNIKRFDLKDKLNSYIIIFDAARQFIGRTKNIVSGKIEEFHIRDIERKKFVATLEDQLANIS